MPSVILFVYIVFTCYYDNFNLCFYIFLKKIVKLLQAATLIAVGYTSFTQLPHATTNSVNKCLYLIDIIYVNLVKQYKVCPFNRHILISKS